MKEDLLKELKTAVKATEQTGIFASGDTEEKVMDVCVRFLRHKGYTVVVPKIFKRKMKSIDDLIRYFYLLANSKHPENYATSYNNSKDRSIAKQFVEGRMNITGAGKDYALNECGEIISTIFDNYDEFNFTYVLSFSIFGQDKLKWVTDRAIQIMNKKLQEQEEKEAEVLRQQALDAYADEPAGFSDLDEIFKDMEERKNAKKESRS